AIVNGTPDMRRILMQGAYRDGNGTYVLQLTTNAPLMTKTGATVPAGTRVLIAVDDFLAITPGAEAESTRLDDVATVQDSSFDPLDAVDEIEEEEEEEEETATPMIANEMTQLRGRAFPQTILSPPVCGCPGCIVTSKWGPRWGRLHQGIDIAGGRTSTPIVAAADGCVSRLRDNRGEGNRGYGNSVYLAHGNGLESQYSHLTRFADGIRPGKCYRRGETIGYMGRTGHVVARRGGTGIHLHFVLLQNNRRVDPWPRFIASAKSQSAMRQRCESQLSYPTTDQAMRAALGLSSASAGTRTSTGGNGSR
ncbi:MAG: M23 family metallopeptidase, partial [Bdellovibrionota bacterium]